MSTIAHTLTLILATDADPRLRPLTSDRAKAAIPFGGVYRIIDFALTNCLRSGLRRVLVLTQYHSHSLQKHLRDGWAIFNPELGEFITPVSPQMRNGQYGYTNSADALRQSLYLLERSSAEYICILSGEHIYRMDYAAMLAFLVDNNADASVACIDCEPDTGFGTQSLVAIATDGRVQAIADGDNRFPDAAPEVRVQRAMGVFAFKKSALATVLKETGAAVHGGQDLAADLVPQFIAGGAKVMAYTFGGSAGRVSCDRYWRPIDSLDDYFRANMDLLQSEPSMDLYQRDWAIRTYQGQHPPARTVPGRSSNEGIFVNSLVANGTVIAGGGVNRSVLFSSVYVDDAATVEDSILLAGVRVGEGAQLYNCIVEKNVKIPAGTRIGFDKGADAKRFLVTERGLVVVAKDTKFV